MKTYSITEIEEGINFWRERTASIVLGAKAKILADIYGKLIYDGHVSIEESALSEAQKDALRVALAR